MQLKIATVEDINGILTLHNKYQKDSIKQEDIKDGFVTTAFTKEQLNDIIQKEQGIFIAIKDNKVLAYVMSASWKYWGVWPMFAYMINELPNLKYNGITPTIDNSYQYGPVCVDKSIRGTGVLEKLFNFALESMSKRYKILITFVNKINPRSFAAHKRKLGLDILQEFNYNDNNYYEMAYDTSKRVHIKD